MGIITSQQIKNYYTSYKGIDIIFSKEVLKLLRVDARQIYIKCSGSQWTCIINSVSLSSAKIIIGTQGGAFAAIKNENTPVSLRFYFLDEYGKPMILFVNSRVVNIQPYQNSNNLAIATLEYIGKPPDDLIIILGSLLDAKNNFVRRSEERIQITPDADKRLNLHKKETLVYIDQVPRNCILRDISFRGAKVLMIGLAQFLKNKPTSLRIEFDEPYEDFNLEGSVVSVENVSGRKDLVALSMKFDEEKIPLAYKIRINKYLVAYQKKILHFIEENQGDAEVSTPKPEQKSDTE